MPFIQLTDFALHYKHVGSGRIPIVLVHGNFASRRWWQPFLNNLTSDEYCVYAPEMRGFGKSETTATGYNIEQFVADLAAFAAQCELEKFHLVGHSLGGAIALQFALDYPEHIETLTLVAPAPAEGMPSLKQSGRLGLPRLSHTLAFHELLRSLNLSRATLKRALKRMMPYVDTETEAFQRLLDDAVRVSPEAIVEIIKALSEWQAQDRLGQLSCPVLVLWGDLDTVIPRLALERMVAALPQAEFVVWSQVGHVPQLEQPEYFTALLLEFIRTHTATATAKPELNTIDLMQQRVHQRWGNWWEKFKKFVTH